MSIRVSSETPSTAGYEFNLTCEVTSLSSLEADVELFWKYQTGEPVVTEGNITVGSQLTEGNVTYRTVFFNPLRSTDEGYYTCLADINLPSNLPNLNSSLSHYVSVLSSKSLLFTIP